MDFTIAPHTYAIVATVFFVVLALLALRSERYFLAATFFAIPVLYFSLQKLGFYTPIKGARVPWTLSLLSVMAFIGGSISLWNSVICDHDWICIKQHQSHDISTNVYRCKKCGEEDHRLE